jgi:hypothetical protein
MNDTNDTEATDESQETEDIIAVINRGQTQQIQLRVSEFKEKRYIDLRTYYFDEKDETFKPTRKGISVPVELYEDLKAAIAKVEDAI